MWDSDLRGALLSQASYEAALPGLSSGALASPDRHAQHASAWASLQAALPAPSFNVPAIRLLLQVLGSLLREAALGRPGAALLARPPRFVAFESAERCLRAVSIVRVVLQGVLGSASAVLWRFR